MQELSRISAPERIGGKASREEDRNGSQIVQPGEPVLSWNSGPQQSSDFFPLGEPVLAGRNSARSFLAVERGVNAVRSKEVGEVGDGQSEQCGGLRDGHSPRI